MFYHVTQQHVQHLLSNDCNVHGQQPTCIYDSYHTTLLTTSVCCQCVYIRHETSCCEFELTASIEDHSYHLEHELLMGESCSSEMAVQHVVPTVMLTCFALNCTNGAR